VSLNCWPSLPMYLYFCVDETQTDDDISICRSSCDCDDDFYSCLKSVSGSQGNHADLVGFVYFQILHPKCIEDYHPLKCKKKM
jgi:hypothetical protein